MKLSVTKIFFDSIAKKISYQQRLLLQKDPKIRVFFWCNVCDFLNLSISVWEYRTRTPELQKVLDPRIWIRGKKLKMGKYFWGNWGKLKGKNDARKKMRKRRKKWRKNEEKTKKIKNEESKETIRKNWGITGENGEISVKMRKMGRKKWGKLGKFLFLKLRSGEIFYFCAFFATLEWSLGHEKKTHFFVFRNFHF